MKTKDSLIIIIAMMLSCMLIFADNIIPVYAYSITRITYDTGGTDVNAVVRLDTAGEDYIITCDDGVNRIRVSTVTDPDTVIASVTITSFAGGCYMIEDSGKIYVQGVGSIVLSEIDHTEAGTWFIARTLSYNTCAFGDDSLDKLEHVLYCAQTSTDQYQAIDLDSMTSIFTSSALTATCDAPNDISISDLAFDNYVVMACTTTNNLATYTLQTSTNLHSESLTGLTDVSVSPLRDRIIALRGSTAGPNLYSYSTATGFSAIVSGITLTGSADIATYDRFGERFVILSGDNLVSAIDPLGTTDADAVLWEISTIDGLSAGQGSELFIENANLFYIPYGPTTDKFGIFDTTDLARGSGATPSEDVGDEFCDIPANANILICRLGGDNNFGGIGNATGTGLLNLGCNVIFVDCTDTNPQTNGLGLLAFIASLFVIIGMFYYAIGKEAFHMPIFIWIVIVVALSAFFTITGWIDPIFLILSIVAIVALAAPKIISVTRGSTFGGGSTE